MTESGRRWYVVETHPHAENMAAAHLQRQGYDIYLPVYRKRRKHARRVEIVSAPLFPRYLFVAIDIAAQRWRSVQSTFGVTRLIAHGNLPLAVADHVIPEIREREDENGYVRLLPNWPLMPGAKVRVLDGAFEACLGFFDAMNDSDRVAILLEFLGRKVRVVLDAASVVAA